MNEADNAWVHPVYGAMVVMPDGYTMTKNQAASKGIKSIPWPEQLERTATPHAHDPDKVVLARGATADKAKALQAGFKIVEAAATILEAPSEITLWRSAIMLLPDARDRPAATAELLSTQSYHTMTVMSARAFLRGLPTELDEQEQPTMTDQVDPARAARLAEIQSSVAGFNRSKGYTARCAPQTASHSARAGGQADPAQLKRRVELKVAALSTRDDAQARSEVRDLRYALHRNATTSTPLSVALFDLGIDVAKIMPNN